jgi:hypothetical protein
MPPKVVVPEGKTFFEVMKRSFVDVPIDESKENAIATTEFLEAAESFKALFGEWLSAPAASSRNTDVGTRLDRLRPILHG